MKSESEQGIVNLLPNVHIIRIKAKLEPYLGVLHSVQHENLVWSPFSWNFFVT